MSHVTPPHVHSIVNLVFRFSIVQYYTDRLGVANGDIPDVNFGVWGVKPYRARLQGSSYWSLSGSISNPWIRVHIGYSTAVSGLLTQGDGQTGSSADWIATIRVVVAGSSIRNADDSIKVNWNK